MTAIATRAPAQGTARPLRPQQRRAAELLALSDDAEQDIAAAVGVDFSTLWRWKRRSDFQGLVADYREAFRARVLSREFADKVRRVIALNQSARKLHKHLEENEYQATRHTAEGAEYQVFDKERYKEFRETLEQIAVEVGDRKQAGGVNVGVAVKVYTDGGMTDIFDVEAWQDAGDAGQPA